MNRNILRNGFIAVIGICVSIAMWIPVFGPHRPYVNWLPWNLAEYLVDNNRSPHECFDLIWFQIMSPTAAEQKALCIHEYAERAKDPAACKLIMPSKYGLSCISNLWPEISGNEACGLNYKNFGIFECRDENGVLHQSKNCEDFKQNEKQFSICLYKFAHVEKNKQDCSLIPDEDIRLFCTTKLDAWEKYPQLRTSSYFGKGHPALTN